MFALIYAVFMTLAGRFTIAVESVLRIDHYFSAGYATTGLGGPVDATGYNEVYTVAEFWREV